MILAETGHHAVIKPWPVRPAVPGGFTLDDFHLDEQNRTLTCPAGQTRPVQRDGKVKFGTLCRGCPLCHFSRSAPGRLGLQPLDLLVDQPEPRPQRHRARVQPAQAVAGAGHPLRL